MRIISHREQAPFLVKVKSGAQADTRHIPCHSHSGGATAEHRFLRRFPGSDPDEQQKEWRSELVKARLNVTPVIDRKYFHSIYFREPGGVLCEIATDPSGFTVDERLEELGTRLVLPSWLEPYRTKFHDVLPTVKLPGTPT